jgi:hypothetical protein
MINFKIDKVWQWGYAEILAHALARLFLQSKECSVGRIQTFSVDVGFLGFTALESVWFGD